MDNYVKNGNEIFLKFCNSPDNLHPLMLPRAPDQTYIDRYPESSDFRDERKRQSDYEAEIIVYRALEKLPDNKIIVLHNFEFTHHQYCLCDQSHLRNKCKANGCKKSSDKEGECDFLIVCPGSIVIIEVKNMSHIYNAVDKEKHFKALSGTFTKSVEQRKKIEYLIQCIEKDTTIRQFTAYPNFKKQFKGQFQASEDTGFQLSESELSTVIFHEDIVDVKKINNNNSRELITSETSTEVIETRETSPEEEQNCFSRFFNCLRGCFLRARDTERLISSDDISSDEDFSSNDNSSDEDLSSFGSWWNNNATIDQDTRINHDAFQKVRNMLLAIWATDKNYYNKSKCSLANCISNIDEGLKSGKFTFLPKKGKNRAQNPRVVPAPDVIRNYVKVENLTVEQYKAFESSENLLWINGPAGAGKSVILCGKIIKLVQLNEREDSKVVLFKFGGVGNNCQLYQCALKEASVKYQETNYMSDVTELVTLISESTCKVIIVEIAREDVQKLTETINAVTNCHIFIDDIQELLYYSEPEESSVLMDKLLSLECIVRVACDMAQSYWLLNREDLIDRLRMITVKLSSTQLVRLSMSLRNTCDLSDILCVIREQLRESYSEMTDILDLVLPTQLQGHFIHGPLTVIHVFNDYNFDNIIRVFNIELDSLCVTSNLNYSDIGIVYSHGTSDVMSLVKDSVKKRCVNTDSKIAVCYSWDCASAQWPAVIVLHSVGWYGEEADLTKLYLTLSRARVYCSVVIFPEEGATLDSYPHMLRLLGKLSNYARIIRY